MILYTQHWTIIDNNLTKDPVNSDEKSEIQGDNVSVKRKLFEDLPEQWEKFRQRRDEYRRQTLLLGKKRSYADAILEVCSHMEQK